MTEKSVRAADVLADALEDPRFRADWEQTALARAVAIRLIRYRTGLSLTQKQLAQRLGMNQSAISRLEDGEHNPTLATLSRISTALGIEFVVDIRPTGSPAQLVREGDLADQVIASLETTDGSQVLIAAT